MIQHAAVISQGIAFILQIAPKQKMQVKANIMYDGYFLVSGTQSSSLGNNSCHFKNSESERNLQSTDVFTFVC